MVKVVMPRAIRRFDDRIEIDWDAVGHSGVYPARMLRLACPCAYCIDEMTSRPLLNPATVRTDVSPREIELVGGYAIRIYWSDHHESGIYPFTMLLDLCPCPSCQEG